MRLLSPAAETGRGRRSGEAQPIVHAIRIGITADDLTGAADSAAAFARRGRPVPVSLTRDPQETEGRHAFAVTTDSRASDPEEVYRLVGESVASLQAAGANLIYKKVDSNLRGNVAAELAALGDALARPILLAPAFPARGRTTVEGVVLVDGVPVAETEMGSDAEAPVRHSDIVRMMEAEGGKLRASRCALAEVRSGAAAVEARLREAEVLVVDAETEADLEGIAEAALAMSPRPVVGGSAGLAAALARKAFGIPEPGERRTSRVGPILAVLASSSKRLAEQIDHAARQPAVETIAFPCDRLSREESLVPELTRAMGLAAEALADGKDAVVYAVGPLPAVARPVELVVEHLAHLAFVVAKKGRPRGLLVGGGATAQGVLEALGTRAVEVEEEPLTGTAGGVTVGGPYGGLPVALKPGAAGGEEAIVELLSYLGRRAAAPGTGA